MISDIVVGRTSPFASEDGFKKGFLMQNLLKFPTFSRLNTNILFYYYLLFDMLIKMPKAFFMLLSFDPN